MEASNGLLRIWELVDAAWNARPWKTAYEGENCRKSANAWKAAGEKLKDKKTSIVMAAENAKKPTKDVTILYLRGTSPLGDVWYQVVGESRPLFRGQYEDREIQTIFPVAVMPPKFGYNGGWTVIDNNIYSAGGFSVVQETMEVAVYKYLLKHDILHKDPFCWENLCSLNIPRATPFLTAFGRKLAIVSGTDDGTKPIISDDLDAAKYEAYVDKYDDDCGNSSKSFPPSVDNDFSSSGNLRDNNDYNHHSGHIFDLDRSALSDFSSRLSFHPSFCATTAVEDPKLVMNYSLDGGYMELINLYTGDREVINGNSKDSPCLSRRWEIPSDMDESISPLLIAIHNSRAVFLNRTLYWFTYQLILYGYDIVMHKWFRSECLEHELHPLKANPSDESPHYPLLFGLPNGNFVLLVSPCREFTMAYLSVNKDVHNSILDVKVEHIQYFLLNDPFIKPFEGIAISLKNTDSDTTQG